MIDQIFYALGYMLPYILIFGFGYLIYRHHQKKKANEK
jgi:hypothetical protein